MYASTWWTFFGIIKEAMQTVSTLPSQVSIPRSNDIPSTFIGISVSYYTESFYRTVLTCLTDQIKRIRRDSEMEHEFSIFWVPRRTIVSDQLLEEAGVLGEASVSEWPLFFVPLADDVLSLELDDAVTDLYLVRPVSPLSWK